MSTFSVGILESTKKGFLGLPDDSHSVQLLPKGAKKWLSVNLGLISPDNLRLLLEVIQILGDSIDEWWLEIPNEARDSFNINSQKTSKKTENQITLWQKIGLTISLMWASFVCLKNFFKMFDCALLHLVAAIEEQISIDESASDCLQITLNTGEEKTIKLGNLIEDSDLQKNIQYHYYLSVPPRRAV